MSPRVFLRNIPSLGQGCEQLEPRGSVLGTQHLTHGSKRSITNSSQGTEAAWGERRPEQGGKKHLFIRTGWENRHSLVSAAEEQEWQERHSVHQGYC